MADSVRDVPHCCQPIFKRKAQRLAYKVFNEESFERVLEEQDMLQFRPRALFRKNDEVPDMSEMEAEKALPFGDHQVETNFLVVEKVCRVAAIATPRSPFSTYHQVRFKYICSFSLTYFTKITVLLCCIL